MVRIKEPQLAVANFTTLLKDVSAETLLDISNMFSSFIDDERYNNELYDVFMSMYRYYEINDIDEEIFKQCVHDTYNQHVEYYKELWLNYNKTYDIKTDNKRITIRSDSSSSSRSESGSSSGSSQDKHYDLPNKTVQSPDGYIDDITKGSDEREHSVEGESSNEYDSTVTTQYNNEFLTLKREYLAQIRNVYEEFISKFKECFMLIYS